MRTVAEAIARFCHKYDAKLIFTISSKGIAQPVKAIAIDIETEDHLIDGPRFDVSISDAQLVEDIDTVLPAIMDALDLPHGRPVHVMPRWGISAKQIQEAIDRLK